MTDVLSEEDLGAIMDRHVLDLRTSSQQYKDRDALLAHIRATSSRPSGAEAMREAAAKVALDMRCEDYSTMTGASAVRLRNQVVAKTIRALPIAPQEVSEDWQPIETAPKGRKIIAGYFNEAGKWRSVMACYYSAKTLDANHEYIDGDEDGYAPEGWYEDGEAYSEALLPTDKPPTHWKPLPTPPQAALSVKEKKNA